MQAKIPTKMSKNATLGAILLLSIFYPTQGEVIHADFELDIPSHTQTTVSTTLASVPVIKDISVRTRLVKITAYTSTPEETDDTPFITASGKTVRDGIVASNFLPLGTRIKIPAIYGDKVFTVEDRMHPRMKNVVDVWMENKGDARQFGVKNTEIAILD
ncbi:MAG TPA: hypothetical protein VJL32_03805 [Candidatus Paceibacterota bacterium]